MEIEWVKSSYSFSTGNCVEVAAWRKPARSIGNGECVEAGNGPGVVAVRDSKHPDGPVLSFTPAQWRVFLLTDSDVIGVDDGKPNGLDSWDF